MKIIVLYCIYNRQAPVLWSHWSSRPPPHRSCPPGQGKGWEPQHPQCPAPGPVGRTPTCRKFRAENSLNAYLLIHSDRSNKSWELAHLLIAQKTLTKIVFFGAFFVCKKNTSNLLIPSFLMSDAAQVAHQKWAMWANRSGCSLCKNERPWVICSGCSSKMSDHEQIPQVAHQKWANEQIVFFFWAIRSENQWANSQPWEN